MSTFVRSFDPSGSASSQIVSLGFGPFFAAQHELLGRAELVPARIAGESHGCYRLLGCRASLGEPSGRLRRELGSLARPSVGDWVAVADDHAGGRAIVHHVFDRRTSLVRRAAGRSGGRQVVAANVDAFFIVTAAHRDLNLRRLERYLCAVLDGGADPVIVLNKIDLVGEDEVASMVDQIGRVGRDATVLGVSAETGAGLAALGDHLGPGRTVGLVGSSGVGKSSLVNRLLGREALATAPIDGDGRGRHTTTRRELVPLPSGGVLVDTPGMRELGLVEDDGGLDASFADVAEAAGSCRFRDCAHQGEPGCAVEDAAASGELDPTRLASYRKLVREVAASERRSGPRARQEERRRGRAIQSSLRARAKLEPKG